MYRLAVATLASACFAQTADFIPPDFVVPTQFKTKSYQLIPLGPSIVKQDYQAYMSSIDHLQKTFGGGKWPTQDITMSDAMKDMENEQSRFRQRKSFAYGVLTLDGSKELGSVYVNPSRKQGYDATVRMWVTKEMFDKGFEDQLFRDVKQWMAKEWPFHKVAFLGREISREDFGKLPEKK